MEGSCSVAHRDSLVGVQKGGYASLEGPYVGAGAGNPTASQSILRVFGFPSGKNWFGNVESNLGRCHLTATWATTDLYRLANRVA
jgi:hypothetical protein